MSDSLAVARPISTPEHTRRLSAARTTEEPWPALPGYEILRRLGHGGMGVVYLARDQRLGRLVALKMIRAGVHAEPEDLVRFETEARAVAGLHHPNIVQLHEAGRSAGLPYFTLEYLPGGTLAERVQQVQMPAREAAILLRDLARAVAHAHGLGVLHRDLKPENVLLNEDGMPKIADFGLARQLQGAGLTGTRDILGTPDYMAPEQARGDAGRVGFPADIYALGAILYRLVTGRPPFQAPTTVDTLRLVIEAEPVPVRALAPTCPRDLETICLKCLHKEPARRYASAGDLADDLERFLAGCPIAARPVGLGERAGRWALRNPVVALLLASTLAGSIVSTVFAVQASWAAAEANARLQQAESAEATAKAAGDAALQSEAKLAAQLQKTHGTLFTAQLARLTPLVETHPDAARRQLLDAGICAPELRDPAWGWLLARSERAYPLLGAESRRAALAFHPQGHLLATVGAQAIEVIDLPSQRVVCALQPIPGMRPPLDRPFTQALTFTRDGKHIVAMVGTSLALWETTTGTLLAHVPNPVGTVTQLVLTPDGSEVWVGAPQRPFFGFSLQPTTPLQVRLNPTAPATALAFTPDGRRLALAQKRGGPDGRGSIEIREWPGQRVVERIPLAGTQPDVRVLAFSPDGQLLAGVDYLGVLRVWDLPRRTLRLARTALTINGASTVLFHPTLPLLGLARQDTLTVLDLAAEGQERLTVDVRATGTPGTFAFHPSGQWLAYHDRQGAPLRLDLAAPREQVTITTAPSGTLLFEPSGTVLLRDRQGMSRRYDLDTGAEVGLGPLFAGPILAWSSAGEGKLVAVTLPDDPARVAVCDRATGLRRVEIVDAGPGVSGGAFAPDGRTVVVVRRVKEELELRGYATQSGELRWQERLPAGAMSGVACDAQGRLAVAVRNVVGFRDIWTGRLLPERIEASAAVAGLHFRGDGALVLTRGVGTLALYDPASGRLLAQMSDENRPLGVLAVSPDGRSVATLSPDRVVRLWNLDTQSLRLTWPLPGIVTDSAAVPTLAHPEFTPDGRRLVIVTDLPRRILRVYDSSTAEEPARRLLPGVRHQVERLRAEPWDVARHDDLAAALLRAGRAEQAALHYGWAMWQRQR